MCYKHFPLRDIVKVVTVVVVVVAQVGSNAQFFLFLPASEQLINYSTKNVDFEASTSIFWPHYLTITLPLKRTSYIASLSRFRTVCSACQIHYRYKLCMFA